MKRMSNFLDSKQCLSVLTKNNIPFHHYTFIFCISAQYYFTRKYYRPGPKGTKRMTYVGNPDQYNRILAV